MSVQFTLNGKPVSASSGDDRTLLWTLRTELELTGTKYGCGEGLCGACTVLVDGAPVRSCMTTLRQVAHKDVLTIEGLAPAGGLHPLQQAFIDHGAFQCGYCTSGVLLAAHALLRSVSKPTREQILAGMDRVLCRCGAHQRIVAAIEAVARRSEGKS
jgi:aerobic-type carbon monoxide dehydrogenase small subunit (CoxS/CutS family)